VSPDGDHDPDMSRSPTHPDRELDDADVEAILGGGPVDVRLDRLATFTRLVRTALLDVPHPVPSDDLARILRGEGPVAAGAAGAAGAGAGGRVDRRRRRGVLVARAAGLGLVAKVVLGASAAAACVTGAGAAGVLPGSANDTVRNAIETVTPVEFDHGTRRPDAGAEAGSTDGHRPGDEGGPWGEGPGRDDDRDGPGDGDGDGDGGPGPDSRDGRHDEDVEDTEDTEDAGEAPGPGGHPDPGDSDGDDLVRPDSTGPGRVDDVGPGAGDQDDPGSPGGAGADGPGAGST
jgi:hypothetical protein